MTSGFRTPIGRQRIAVAATLAFVMIAGTGCAGDQPASAAKTWLEAVAASEGNKIGSLTCASEQGNTQFGMGLLTAMNWLSSGLLGATAEIDVGDVQFTTTSQTGEEATVQVSGQLRAAIGALWQSQTMSSVLTMVVEDGRWKYCGST
ncbi:MAG: hypothetical protein QOJ81_2233 [Chloroflexota bacterium]|jgi:hypothetical protein|nr:hypothetical protein [Chloroflexota bacterium]